jgi:hypothetical protein
MLQDKNGTLVLRMRIAHIGEERFDANYGRDCYIRSKSWPGDNDASTKKASQGVVPGLPIWGFVGGGGRTKRCYYWRHSADRNVPRPWTDVRDP